jgi:hypothetical protein
MVPEVYQVFWAGMAAGEFHQRWRDRGRQLSQARHPLVGCGGRRKVLPSRWMAATVYDDMWVDPDDDPGKLKHRVSASGRH